MDGMGKKWLTGQYIQAYCSACLPSWAFLVLHLPNTPPPKKGTKTTFGEIVGAESLRLLKDKNFLIFFLSSLLICIPLGILLPGNQQVFK